MSKQATYGKRIVYTKHALKRMVEYHISQSDVEAIRDNGSVILRTKNKEVRRLGKKGRGIQGVFLKYEFYLLLITVIREQRL